MFKAYNCRVTKQRRKQYSIDLGKTLATNLSENDSVNQFVDCIERVIHTQEPEEDKVDDDMPEGQPRPAEVPKDRPVTVAEESEQAESAKPSDNERP
jgi:hypothetical protein